MNNTSKYDVGINIENIMLAHRNRNAVNVDNKYYDYESLYVEANLIRHTINNVTNLSNQFVGIFCYRSINAYIGIAGTLFSKNAFLPLNPFLPVEKLSKIISASNCKIIILSEEAVDKFKSLSQLIPKLTILCPNPKRKIKDLKQQDSRHTFILPDKFSKNSEDKTAVSEKDPAYLMFTSGSTGEPKGIKVSHKNLHSYANYMIRHYKFDCSDRISQAPDISFDLSIHDIFSAFYSGGCLYVLPKEVMSSPHKYINEHKLTAWTSVPSVGIFMDNLKQLKPNSLPSLRLSFFCGEGLPCELASKWKRAAINSQVVNFYGPTEATVMFTSHQWDLNCEVENCFNGLVSIGKPFEHMQLKLINNGKEVEVGQVGEIFIFGDQVIEGYFNDAVITEEKFLPLIEDTSKIWYRTGDLAKKSPNGNYFFVGRVDDQIQVRGNRVEMLAIDNALRDVVGHHLAISIPLMSEASNVAEDIVAFVQNNGENLKEEKILEACSHILADYMVPSKIFFLDEMPLNQNGKINKKILFERVNDPSNRDLSVNNDDFTCGVCLKDLSEDKKLGGFGLLKVINHDRSEGYICHVCLKGF